MLLAISYHRLACGIGALLIGLAFSQTSLAANVDPVAKGLKIAQENDIANTGFTTDQSTMEMTLVNAHGDVVFRKMKSWVLEGAAQGDRSLVQFVAPADVKGTRMLTHSKKVGSDQQWLYLPAIKRVKRISSRNRSGSFMGSEFAYEDLGSQELEKYHYQWLADEIAEGRALWKLQRIPVDKKSGYSKQEIWIDKAYRGAIRVDYYDQKGDLLKTASFDAYKQYGKYWRPNKIHMRNHQTRKQSVLVWKDRVLGKALEVEMFESSSLEDEE
ncbi:MAG: outer membrane lipoprotein-sorting protein [Myxococcota bacterium]|nr:outer membrane lipoprotein-sorting protein [Myxococcota bacterium]